MIATATIIVYLPSRPQTIPATDSKRLVVVPLKHLCKQEFEADILNIQLFPADMNRSVLTLNTVISWDYTSIRDEALLRKTE